MWTYNNITITTIGLKEAASQNLVELQPIEGGTVYQIFGYANKDFSLECYVVGSGDKDSIEAMAITASSYPLIANGFNLGNFYLKTVNFQWVTAYAQTFRPDKPRESLIFRGSLELSRA